MQDAPQKRQDINSNPSTEVQLYWLKDTTCTANVGVGNRKYHRRIRSEPREVLDAFIHKFSIHRTFAMECVMISDPLHVIEGMSDDPLSFACDMAIQIGDDDIKPIAKS